MTKAVSAGPAGPLAHSRTSLIQATRYCITATDPLPDDFRLACPGRQRGASASPRNVPLLDEPVPTLADPFPSNGPLAGAYELHLPADNVTVWYTVAVHEGQEVISGQHVSLDT